jgi:hypothetical protein
MNKSPKKFKPSVGELGYGEKDKMMNADELERQMNEMDQFDRKLVMKLPNTQDDDSDSDDDI